MKVGITGANGHVGANLIRRLLKDGHHVRVLQYHHHKGFDGLEVEVMTGDVNDNDLLAEFCSGMNVVYHLAAKISIGHNSYEALFQTNVEGSKNILNSSKAAGVKRFIHFSSIHAFQHSPVDEPMDESRPRALLSSIPYEKTKSIAEEWVLDQQSQEMDVIVLNPTAIIGPNDFKPSLLGQFIIKLYNGSIPGLVPGGYDWVDVRDICDAAANALHQGKGGEKYILSGHYKSVLEVADLLGQVTGKKIKKRMLPLWLAHLGVPFIYLWSKLTGQKPLYTRQSLDILQEGNKHIINEKARRELGFNPRPLSVTLKDTFTWFKHNEYIKE